MRFSSSSLIPTPVSVTLKVTVFGMDASMLMLIFPALVYLMALETILTSTWRSRSSSRTMNWGMLGAT